jgi:hypothetical protein
VKRLTLLLSVLLLAAFALATTIVPMSVEEITAKSSRIVEGRAQATWSEWDASHRVLLTYTKFAVSKTLKGGATREVVVQQLGGTDGILTQKVAGVRHFQVGENTLLFLRPGDSSDSPLNVVGLMQGNFRILTTSAGDTIASNGVADTFVLKGGQPSDFNGTQIPLSVLESRIRKAVGQ